MSPGREQETADLPDFEEALEKAKSRGYTALELRLPWDKLQPRGQHELDFSLPDGAMDRLKTSGIAAVFAIDYMTPPDWFPGDEFGMRDGHNRLVVSGDDGRPLPAINAKRVRDHVAGIFKACAAHFKGTGGIFMDPGPFIDDPARKPESPQLDHSRWATDAFRLWLRDRYVDVRSLNRAWDSSFEVWDQIGAGEGVRRSSQADFHLFRAATLASWTEFMAKAVKGGDPEAGYAYRAAAGKSHANLEQLSFDLGRFSGACDLLLVRGACDSWSASLARSASALAGCEWCAGIDPKAVWGKDEAEIAGKEAAARAKAVYADGGWLWVENPGDDPACRALEREARGMLQSPALPRRENRQAIYVSAAEAQFWDGTDLDAARLRWNELTESGKKPKVDIVTDGMFAGNSEALRRYTAGVEVPFARTIARDTRAALVQAVRAGVRLIIANPGVAGSLDEHGKPQAPLV